MTHPCRYWSDAEGICPNPHCQVHGDRQSNLIRATLIYGLPTAVPILVVLLIWWART